MRFITEIDEGRQKAGWGLFSWVIDTTKTGDDRLIRLLPKNEAEAEVARLNSGDPSAKASSDWLSSQP
jgi:hypothetical protein